MGLKDRHYAFMRDQFYTDEEIAADWEQLERDYVLFLEEHVTLRDEDIEKIAETKEQEVPF